MSGVRKELLLFLDDGPRSLSEIKDRFDMTAPEVSPRIKELIEHHLVKYEDKKYHLTPMGKTIMKNFVPFADTVNVFDSYSDWWEAHDLSSIPNEMLYRMGEIKNYTIIEDDASDINRTRAEFFNIVNRSTNFAGVSCVFLESLPELCATASKNNVPISIVVTDQIYTILKINYSKELRTFLKNEDAELYVIQDSLKVSHIVTNDCIFLSLCYNNGKFDLQGDLISFDKSSIKWGMDLYNYYKRNSIKVIT
jgi:predicted transcriptional regulator